MSVGWARRSFYGSSPVNLLARKYDIWKIKKTKRLKNTIMTSGFQKFFQKASFWFKYSIHRVGYVNFRPIYRKNVVFSQKKSLGLNNFGWRTWLVLVCVINSGVDVGTCHAISCCSSNQELWSKITKTAGDVINFNASSFSCSFSGSFDFSFAQASFSNLIDQKLRERPLI